MAQLDPLEYAYLQIASLTDARLLDLYHDAELLTSPPERRFSKAEVMSLMRGAFWTGVDQLASDVDGELERLAESLDGIE